ncbi:family 43 glycosylhydrolase [Nocardioides lianchengensis]|uniref:Glycosyl hydrolases family 43 n=1 Tax=Nocardioides lianchengensis TaxID=1045774 RepID=A0A1G6QBE0_9ACTN|nr:family 43 glycosylhydrolase [Nocardioides lianchengensis]NYG12162.1 beta-xylosidase [Nocardioides lianchengensis]SDC89628.1 Glycosyl hydrolases family 43 [Nocardioides lianchengensis]
MTPAPPPSTLRALASAVVLALCGGLLLATPARAAAADVTDGLLLRYDLTQASGTTVTDSSGNGRDGTVVGGGTWSGAQGLALDGVDDHVKLPNNVMAGLSSITVSTDVFIESSQATPYFIWGLGNPATSSTGTGYLMASGNGFRAATTPGNWSGEKVTARTSGGNLARGVWKTVTYTQTGTTGTLYEDGVQVGQNTAVSVLPSAIGNGTTTNNVLGESNYAADNTLKGKVKNFRIYSRALSAGEVADISLTDANRVAGDKDALSLGDVSAVTANLALPTTGAFGSAVAWASSDPSVISTTGAVTRPGVGADPAQVTLTATITKGASSETKTFAATVLPADSDQSKADAAAAALALVHADDVRGHLTLPATGRHGSTVTWASSAPAVVSTTGLVTRPAHGAGDTSVTLTATVTVGAATATRAIPLTVREKRAAAPYAGYAFSYFANNSIQGEKIYFAASKGNNALRWDELNGGQPVLESTYGEMGLRDPFLIRSPEGDRFFLIATDLSIGRNGDWDRSQRTGSRYLEVWESTDLKTWSAQRHVLVSPPTAGNTWAPEAYWDEELQQYVVFWASKLYAESDVNHTGSTYNRMLYATTRDFVTFSEAKIWQDRGESRIDSTVIKEGDTFYRFTKDEGGGGTGCSDIIQEKASSLTAVDQPGAPTWQFMKGCIGKGAGTSAVEGPTVFKRNPGDTSGGQYYLFVDEYGGRGYIPLTTDDLENPDWKVPTGYKLPASPRHGTVIPVTQAELDALRADLPAPPPPVQSTEDGLVASYPLSGDAKDTSGHGYDGTLVGDTSFVDGALNLGGTAGHVKLPNNLMSGLEEITVSTKVWVDSAQTGNYFVWNLGNTGTDGNGNGYLFATGNSTYRAAIASGNWTTEQGMTSGSALGRGAWKTLTYTLGGGASTLYLDGRQVARNANVSLKPGDLGDGVTTANYLGRSAYNGDNRLRGKLRDVRIYSRALSAGEVAELAAAPTDIVNVTLGSLKAPVTIDGTAGTVTLPVEPGTDLTTLNPTYVVPAGATVTPSGPADYTSPVQVTVTNGGASRTWTVRAVVMRSPVLPGLYADPNIAVFDGVYYLYATTDGTPGWGGKDFYVWSSTNLVDWTRSEQPFLTLDGANGNVPWATGNAWAPTIIERGGKYYFYFSGHNPTYNRKTIGVAVADSPTGPFTAQPQAMILNNESVTSGQAIDPAAFHDPVSGKYYLYWGNGSPVMAELADDMVSLKPGTISAMSGLTSYREGSFMNYRNGIYHLTYAIDDTGSPNYRVGYATSTSPTGPWTYRGVILEKDESQGILATGHSSIVQVPGTDEWYIAYHRFAIPGGNGTNRETTIDRLTFGEDGLIQKVVPTLSSVAPLAYTDGPVTATVSDAGSSGWYGAAAALTLSGSAPTLQYRLGSGEWTTYTAAVDLPAGSYDVAYRARGANLQWSETWTEAVKVDDVVPTVTAAVADRVVTLTASDADSGVALVEYHLDGGGWLAYTGAVELDGAAHTVSFRVTDVAGNTSAVDTVSVDAASGPTAPSATALPVVSGSAVVGQQLAATTGRWSVDGLSFGYQWLRDGAAIRGATASRYRLAAADVGRRISVQVTARAGSGPAGVARSVATRAVAKATGTVTLKVARTAKAGRPVTVRITLAARPSSVAARGAVTLRVDGKVVKRVANAGRTTTVKVRLKAGKHTLKVAYAGSATVTADTATAVVRARR